MRYTELLIIECSETFHGCQFMQPPHLVMGYDPQFKKVGANENAKDFASTEIYKLT